MPNIIKIEDSRKTEAFSTAANAGRILIVEDDPISRALLETNLRKSGYETVSAENGRAALEILSGDYFPIVITDLMTPELGGIELCQTIRKGVYPGYVFIIMITDSDSQDKLIAGIEAGADEYLTRPFNTIEIVARLSTAKRVLDLEKSLNERSEEIRKRAIYDPLTETYNRLYLMEKLPQEIKRSARYCHELSIILCDIDHFRRVNDTYGHHVGDLVLRELARLLKAAIRDGIDWVSRYGGEEFLIVLPETDLYMASKVAERIRLIVAEKEMDLGITVTASFGVASTGTHWQNDPPAPDALLDEADKYLYEAKKSGRNAVSTKDSPGNRAETCDDKIRKSKRKVLVVDNHPVTLKVVSDVLIKEGHHVVLAKDGISAIEVLRTFIPDVVFTDLIMPNIDGARLCKVIRGTPALKDVFLVVLSSVAAEEGEKVKKTGADAFVAKGPVKKMAEHILEIMDELDRGHVFGLSEPVRGIEDIYSRQITRELLFIKERFEEVLNVISEGVLEVSPKGEILYLNSAATAVLDSAEDQLLATPFMELFKSPDAERIAHLFDSADSGVKEISGNMPVVLNQKEVAVKKLPGSNGNSLIMIEDLSEKNLIRAQLQQLVRLDSLGVLAGGIAHDFNNLLQGVFGYMSMAKMRIDPKDKAYAMLDQAERALNMSVNLTSQLLTFSKGGKPVKKRIALQEVIENATRFALSGSHCDYCLSVAKDLRAVNADEGQLGQVIQNIVLNASEAMPERGTVKISVENADIAPGVNPSVLEGGKFVKISIEDSGTGIPEMNQSRIFEPYFTTKQKGSGLGLAASYSIIKNHGGMIEVKSEADKGSIFSIHVPACEDEEKEKLSVPEPNPGRKGKILVMDDEEMIRTVAREMIDALGHEVESVADGESAIEKFKEARISGRPFDVVILDLTIKGGLGGEQIIKKLQEIDPHIKAIVSSGYADIPIISNYSTFGFAAFLNKPYRIDLLRDSLNALLGS